MYGVRMGNPYKLGKLIKELPSVVWMFVRNWMLLRREVKMVGYHYGPYTLIIRTWKWFLVMSWISIILTMFQDAYFCQTRAICWQPLTLESYSFTRKQRGSMFTMTNVLQIIACLIFLPLKDIFLGLHWEEILKFLKVIISRFDND